MSSYIGAIDQGTTSTRFIVFDRSGRIVASAQKEHEQIYPQPGWVEHDPEEIWRRTQEVIARSDGAGAASAPRDLAAIGITNQRETTVLWDRKTGAPGGQCHRLAGHARGRSSPSSSRAGGPDRFRARTGLPLSTYFSGLKIRWMLDHVPGARARAEAGDLLFGNIDTFLVWHLTGGDARHRCAPTPAAPS